jgi:PKD repeat protein
MSSSRALLPLLLLAALAGCSEHVGGAPDNERPVARITVSPPSGPAPLAVTVSASASTDGDGTITGYAWTFGDGTTASGVTAEHTFATVGDFAVTLTVTDNDGATGTATASVVATGTAAVYNASAFDNADFQDEPASGTYDTTTLQ